MELITGIEKAKLKLEIIKVVIDRRKILNNGNRAHNADNVIKESEDISKFVFSEE